jgi:tRNA A37 threonylcarbamoyltransferase TsaD
MSSEVFVRVRLGLEDVILVSMSRPPGMPGRLPARALPARAYCMVTAVELDSLTHVPPVLHVSWLS